MATRELMRMALKKLRQQGMQPVPPVVNPQRRKVFIPREGMDTLRAAALPGRLSQFDLARIQKRAEAIRTADQRRTALTAFREARLAYFLGYSAG